MLGNGHGSGPSLVELGMALERPASGVNSGSAQKAAAAAAGQGPQAGTQKSPKSAGVHHPCCSPASSSRFGLKITMHQLISGSSMAWTVSIKQTRVSVGYLRLCQHPKHEVKMLRDCSLLEADSCTHPAGASKERERNSFFDSLRRKSRSPSLAPLGEGEDADADVAEAADAETPSGATAAEPASPVTNARAVPDSAAVTPEPAERQQHTPPASSAAVGESNPAETTPAKPGGQPDPAPKPSSSGSLGERLLIPAEEEAFLRSLGWEGDDMDDDDEEGENSMLHVTWEGLYCVKHL